MSASAGPANPTGAATPKAPAHLASSPDSLDELITTTKTHAWWALWAIAAAVLFAFIWSVVATIPQQVSGLGVVSSFDYISDLSAPVAGIVHNATAEPGGAVAAGEVVAVISPYGGGEDVPVLSPVDGTMHSVFVNKGEGVDAGMVLAQVVANPDPSKGIRVITYLPASAALNFDEGQVVAVTFTDISSSDSVTTTASVEQVANVPSAIESMKISAGSASIAEQWLQEAGGTPYRIAMEITDWSATGAGAPPAPGSVVSIVNTYASLHPIELLFGGN